MILTWFWIPFTLFATLTQTFRNGVQRNLTGYIGTLAATYVRFLYGLPFALLFLVIVHFSSGDPLPAVTLQAVMWFGLGGLAQIIATALMLAAMRQKSFVITIAYTKTEPVQIALYSLIFLRERVSFVLIFAIVLATLGVMAMSWPRAPVVADNQPKALIRPVIYGLVSAAFFALAAVWFRFGILNLTGTGRFMAATTGLAIGLSCQSVMILAYTLARDRPSLHRVFRLPKLAATAGFLGALASQFWFLGFALTSATNVRTLAMVEVLFAQIVSRKFFQQGTTLREKLGIVLLMLGAGIVTWLGA